MKLTLAQMRSITSNAHVQWLLRPRDATICVSQAVLASSQSY